MRLIHFPHARPRPFAISLSGTTIDDFGNEVLLLGDAQWFAAATFTDDNFFDHSLGFDAGGWRQQCI
jgi:hypothetical protein